MLHIGHERLDNPAPPKQRRHRHTRNEPRIDLRGQAGGKQSFDARFALNEEKSLITAKHRVKTYSEHPVEVIACTSSSVNLKSNTLRFGASRSMLLVLGITAVIADRCRAQRRQTWQQKTTKKKIKFSEYVCVLLFPNGN